MKKLLLCLAAFGAAVLGAQAAQAQCCAGRCVVGAGRVVASVARPIVATRGRCVVRSYSTRVYYSAPTFAAYGCDVDGGCVAVPAPAFVPEIQAPPAPVVEPCAPIETTAPDPCEAVGEYKPVKRVETARRVLRSCPGGICPLF